MKNAIRILPVLLFVFVAFASCTKERGPEPPEVIEPCIEDERGELKLFNKFSYELTLTMSIQGGGSTADSTVVLSRINVAEHQTYKLKLGKWLIRAHGTDGNAPYAHNEWDFNKYVEITDCGEPAYIEYPF